MKHTKLYEHCTFVDVDYNSDLHTNCGLHLKVSGKDAIVKQVVCYIHDRLCKEASTPIGLDWKNDSSTEVLEEISSPVLMENCMEVVS